MASGGAFGAKESVDICHTETPSSAPSTKEPSPSPSETCTSMIQMTMDNDSQTLQINIEGSDKKLQVRVIDGDFDLTRVDV